MSKCHEEISQQSIHSDCVKASIKTQSINNTYEAMFCAQNVAVVIMVMVPSAVIILLFLHRSVKSAYFSPREVKSKMPYSIVKEEKFQKLHHVVFLLLKQKVFHVFL